MAPINGAQGQKIDPLSPPWAPPWPPGGPKSPVFDDFTPCRESHGEHFPGGIKSRAAVWRKLGLVHFLTFLWLLLCRQRNGGCFYVPRESGPALCGCHTASLWLPHRPRGAARKAREAREARAVPGKSGGTVAPSPRTHTQDRYPALRGEELGAPEALGP